MTIIIRLFLVTIGLWTLPLYPSQGATVELWDRKLKQLENNFR